MYNKSILKVIRYLILSISFTLVLLTKFFFFWFTENTFVHEIYSWVVRKNHTLTCGTELKKGLLRRSIDRPINVWLLRFRKNSLILENLSFHGIQLISPIPSKDLWYNFTKWLKTLDEVLQEILTLPRLTLVDDRRDGNVWRKTSYKISSPKTGLLLDLN